jgi:hypothetical protein
MKFVLSLLLGTALAGTVCARAPAPVLDVDFPDPFVLVEETGLTAYATNTVRDGKRLNVQVSRSTDGLTWSAPADAMPTRPAWAASVRTDVWAPEAIKLGDTYVLYFSARHRSKRRPDGFTLCVGAAVADRPEGPFAPQPEPLTCGGRDGVIDASPLKVGEHLLLYTKTDGNCCGAPITVLVQRLTPDGLKLDSGAAPVAGVTNDQPWEGNVVEGPQMHRFGGEWVMIFAANDYGGDDYAVGYAVCRGPLGPCEDAPENPILKKSEGLSGPGHPTVFEWNGRTWMAHHAWRSKAGKRYRPMFLRPLEWIDGKPVLGPTIN